MLRKDSSLDTTLLHLDVVNNNLYVEIDTRNGYEYRKVCSYSLRKNGSLNAVVVDDNDISGFRSISIAKATGLKRSCQETRS